MITEEDRKQFFRDLADHRKQNAIKLSRFLVTTDREQAGVLAELWNEWEELLGKDGSVKFLVYCMNLWTEALRQAKQDQDASRAKAR